MYIMFTFILIILIPTFLGLLFTTNIKENINFITIVALGITFILGYMYIPSSLPVNKNLIENPLVYYENQNTDKSYQDKFLLMPMDIDAFMTLLKQQKFYRLMDDRQYYYGNSKQFELFDKEYMEHGRLSINKDTYSALSIGNKNYRFKANIELIELADTLSRQYRLVAYDSTDIESLDNSLTLKDVSNDTYLFDLMLQTLDDDTLITELNLYYAYSNDSSSLSYLLSESPIKSFNDSFETYKTRGQDEYLQEIKDCQLIIRGQHRVGEGVVPFQQLIDMNVLITE